MKTVIPFLLLATLTGCALPFSGKRDVDLKVNILGNTVEWKSNVAGDYVQPDAPAGNVTIPE